MKVFKTKIELQSFLNEIKTRGVKIGFVPTMGALHSGHLSLIKSSNEENDYTIVSIFVNRLQFNNNNDFERYPIDLQSDLNLLESTDCDILFAPEVNEIFPPRFKRIKLNLGRLDSVLEGEMRPGHYNGVVQVVYRLFNYIKPDSAYFGLKDYQQCLVIKQLKNTYFPGIRIKCCTTERMKSGLALSSRNAMLSEEGLKNAEILNFILVTVKSLSEHIAASDALNYARFLIHEKEIKLEYLELMHADSFNPGKKWFRKGKNVVLIAAWIDDVRLIDNIVF